MRQKPREKLIAIRSAYINTRNQIEYINLFNNKMSDIDDVDIDDVEDNEAIDDKKNRRGPGRPPIKQPIQPIEKHGIIKIPKDSNNRLEFVYSDPLVFKSIFTYFRNIKAKEIHIQCSPTGMVFYARDHGKTSRIVAKINGNGVNWYYCKSTFWLGINRDNVEKMFSSIDKTFCKISIVQSIEDVNTLTFIFKDNDLEKECNYKITLSSFSPDDDLYRAEEDSKVDFPINFTLSAKQFKKTINDISNYSDKITFEKIGDYPLQLTYTKSNIVYNEIFRNNVKINLQSCIEKDFLFRSEIKVANIKSLATSMVTNEIKIFCKNSDFILFYSEFGNNSFSIYTLTKLC